jgi:hypothetical protein
MAITITIEQKLNLGDTRGVVFKGVAGTSGTNAIKATDVGLAKFLGVVQVGGASNVVGVFSGAARSTTGNLQLYDGAGANTSGTFYGLAFGY